MRRLMLLLMLLIPRLALAQYPSPIFNTVTVNGALSATGGGTLGGNYGGTPTMSALWTFNGGLTGNFTGGTINGTPIGATTPSTGAFTTASTTGNLTVGATLSAVSMTLSGSGTALNVTNNALIGGQLSVTNQGVFGASTQTLTINGNRISTGGTTNTAVFTILLNTTTSQLFRINGTDGVDSTPTPIMDINGSTLSNSIFYNQLSLNNSNRGNSYDLIALGQLNGTPPVGAWYPIFFGYTDNMNSASKGGNGIMTVQETQTTSAAAGSRETFTVGFHLTGASGNLTGGNYVAATFSATASANDNGTGTNWGSVNVGAGSYFAQNNTTHLFPGATWTAGIDGWEDDIEVDNGAQVNVKTGMSVVLLDPANSATPQGAWEDDAIVLGGGNNAQVVGQGWRNGIVFGRPQSAFPMDPTGVMINAGPVNGTVTTPMTAGVGVDFSQVNFGTAFIRSRQFLVDPAGVARFGTGAIAYTGSGMSVDVNYLHGLPEGTLISGATIVDGGTGQAAGGQVWADNYNGLYSVTATNGSGVITQLTVVRQSFAPVGSSATVPIRQWQYGVTNGTPRITQTWTTDTALSVQPGGGATTIGGSISVTGNATFSTILGSSNLVIAPAATSNVISFKSSAAGSILATIGGTTGSVTIQPGSYLSLPGKVWSGGAIQGNAALYSSGTWTGSTGGSDAQLFFLQAVDSIDTGVGRSVNALVVKSSTTGTGWTGNRGPFVAVLDISSSPSAANNGAFVGGRMQSFGHVNVGGTAPTFGNSAGAVFGFNAVGTLDTTATNWAAVVGGEVDVALNAGATAMDRYGLTVIDITGGAQATRDDIGIGIGGNGVPASGVGFRTGISFGVTSGLFPISTAGTIIGATLHQGGVPSSFTVANGIDWSLGIATNKWLQFGSVFSIDGSGNVTAAGYKAGAAAGVSCAAGAVTPATTVVTSGIITHC